MDKQRFRIMFAVAFLFIAGAYCVSKCAKPSQTHPQNNIASHMPDRLNSILWIQTSAEYQMVATQSYLLAKHYLARGLEDSSWTAALEQSDNYSQLPPAIIVDVDETVLDNSPYYARLEHAGKYWDDELWNNWVLEMYASDVPGSVEFLQYAQTKGVMVFFITNRVFKHERATRSNLISLGFPISNQVDNILTMGEKSNWGYDKTSRRNYVAEQYRIILIIGDDANDFISVTSNYTSERQIEIINTYREKWIVLPNPIYGSWEFALYFDKIGPSDTQIFESKFEGMDTLE